MGVVTTMLDLPDYVCEFFCECYCHRASGTGAAIHAQCLPGAEPPVNGNLHMTLTQELEEPFELNPR